MEPNYIMDSIWIYGGSPEATGTHRDQRERAARVDRDVTHAGELGVGSDAIAVASGAAREGRGLP